MAKRKKTPENSARLPEGLVVSSWKGIPYIRSQPPVIANPQTEPQQHQRSKMVVALRFLRSNILMVRIGFRLFKAKRSAFNAALSHTLKYAVTGAGEEMGIDYEQALLSKGNLEKPSGAKFRVLENELVVSWDWQTGEGNARATDRAMISVYNPQTQASLFLFRGAKRGRGGRGQKIKLPESFRQAPLKVFLAFNSYDELLVSDSVLCEEI